MLKIIVFFLFHFIYISSLFKLFFFSFSAELVLLSKNATWSVSATAYMCSETARFLMGPGTSPAGVGGARLCRFGR